MTTPLDEAFAAMEAEGTDAARLAWFDLLVASELFLLLEAEAEGDTVRPRVFEVEDGLSSASSTGRNACRVRRGRRRPMHRCRAVRSAGCWRGRGWGLR
jgi:hypothetical protein